MTTPEVSPRGSRETRLLLVTIAISVGVLLLLARFRFPADPGTQPVESAPAPLERLAARAAYDELASIMADLERRIAPRIVIIRTQSADGSSAMSVAPRLLPDRAVAIVPADHTVIAAGSGGEQELINLSGAVAVMRVPAVDDSAVTIRPLPLRSGPRYVVVVEPTSIGPALTPLYVGRVDSFDDPHTGVPLLSFAGLQRRVSSGTAIFSLEGSLVGLVRDGGDTLTVVPAEALRSAAESAQPSTAPSHTTLGVEVDVLTAALSRATGADRGVIVVYVPGGGPADGTLRAGDVIQSVGDMQITSPTQFREIERSRAADAPVTIAGVRAGAPLQVTIQPAASAGESESQDDPGLISRSVAGLGIEVIAVREGSAAARGGLQRGDVITSMDGDTSPGAADLTRRFRSAKPGAILLLTVLRGDQHLVLPLEKR